MQKSILVLVVIFLISCTSQSGTLSTPSKNAPEPRTGIQMTPTNEIERWAEYENALALEYLPYPNSKGLCEWEVFGQSEKEVFVWAICQVSYSADGVIVSAPAVIYLDVNGDIDQVAVPGNPKKEGSDYAADIRKLFPETIQERIFSQDKGVDIAAMLLHIEQRHKNSEPPLIVLSGIALP